MHVLTTAPSLPPQERVELQKQRDADQKEELLQKEMKRLRRLRKEQDVREEERLDKAKKAEAKRTFDPMEYADCHLRTRLAY